MNFLQVAKSGLLSMFHIELVRLDQRELGSPNYLTPGRGTIRGSVIGNIGGEEKCVVEDNIIDVDAVVLPRKTWSGFGINNRLGVWKMMTIEEKTKITTAYERHRDGYVIDTYSEVLKTEQYKMYANDETTDKSYFFSSICLDMV
ncbi:hypothetical protein CsSME_00033315 [Camellia sinensis var. sinensis]